MNFQRTHSEKECIKVGLEGFVVQESQLLLGKRRNVPGDGEWGLPGGHLEQGDGLEQTLCRELHEELGIVADAGAMELKVVVNDPDNIGGHYLHFGFQVPVYSGSISVMEPDKCAEWRFFPIDNLPSNVFSAHRQLLSQFLRSVIYDGARACTNLTS